MKPLVLEHMEIFGTHVAFRIIHQDEDYISRGSSFYDKDSGIRGGSDGPHCLFSLYTRGCEAKYDLDVMLVDVERWRKVEESVDILNRKIMDSAMWKINHEVG